MQGLLLGIRGWVWDSPTRQLPNAVTALTPRKTTAITAPPSKVTLLPSAVSTKDLIETCCAAGQQWAIDNDECLGIPENGAEGDVCR